MEVPTVNVDIYFDQAIAWLLSSGVHILLIFILMLVGLKVARVVSGRMMDFLLKHKDEDPEFRKRAETLSSVIRYALTVGIAAIGVIMILGEIGIEIGPILAAAGVLGLAIGFGAQNLVQDVISGFFILLENQIRVGDVVQIAGKAGLVEKVNLRMTILRDLSGTVHYVRNGQINIVSNMTKDFSCCVFDIGVAYRENIDEVISIIKEVDEELRNDPDYQGEILEPLEVFGLDKFADSAIVVKARYKTKPIKQWHVARGFNLRLKKKFDQRDIEIPFPHLTLYMGEDKQGQSPPLNIAVEENSRAFAKAQEN